MKNFIKRAMVDYFTTCNPNPTLMDIAEICDISLADLVFDALQEATRLRKKKQRPDIPEERARKILYDCGQTLIGKPVGEVLNAIIHLKKTALDYGYEFFYATREGMFVTIQHTRNDEIPVIGFELQKIKKL